MMCHLTWTSQAQKQTHFQPSKTSCSAGFQGIAFTRITSLSGILFLPRLSCNAARSPEVPGLERNTTLERSAVSHRSYLGSEAFFFALRLLLSPPSSLLIISSAQTSLKSTRAPLSPPEQVRQQLQCLSDG